MKDYHLNNIESLTIEIRNQKVILDSDVAAIYGVATRDINKAVKNNLDKFPAGYIFEISKDEKSEVVENFHHLEKLKFSPNLPKAFIEKGLHVSDYSQIKTSDTSNPEIIETFAKIRHTIKKDKKK